MKKVQNGLTETKYTEVYQEKEFNFNAPHYFEVRANQEELNILAKIHFQEGPIKEYGVNGVTNEDLLAMVITRLEHFQNSDFRCRENALALTKLEEALLWLKKRTLDREARGVEGKHIK